MTYDRKDPDEVLSHAGEATWEDGQRLGVKDGPFGLISYQPLNCFFCLASSIRFCTVIHNTLSTSLLKILRNSYKALKCRL